MKYSVDFNSIVRRLVEHDVVPLGEHAKSFAIPIDRFAGGGIGSKKLNRGVKTSKHLVGRVQTLTFDSKVRPDGNQVFIIRQSRSTTCAMGSRDFVCPATRFGDRSFDVPVL